MFPNFCDVCRDIFTFLVTFFWHLVTYLFDVFSGIFPGILSWQFFWHIFPPILGHALWVSFWHMLWHFFDILIFFPTYLLNIFLGIFPSIFLAYLLFNMYPDIFSGISPGSSFGTRCWYIFFPPAMALNLRIDNKINKLWFGNPTCVVSVPSIGIKQLDSNQDFLQPINVQASLRCENPISISSTSYTRNKTKIGPWRTLGPNRSSHE